MLIKVGVPIVPYSKARLVETRVCFILEAGNWKEDRLLSTGSLSCPLTYRQSVGKRFYRWRERATCGSAESIVSSGSHLEFDHGVVWSSHFDCFLYS